MTLGIRENRYPYGGEIKRQVIRGTQLGSLFPFISYMTNQFFLRIHSIRLSRAKTSKMVTRAVTCHPAVKTRVMKARMIRMMMIKSEGAILRVNA